MSEKPDKRDRVLSAWLEGQLADAAHTRSSVIQVASRMIEALQGETPQVRRIPFDPSETLASAPAAIPALNWQNYDARLIAEEEAEGEPDYWQMSIVGNVGEYYSRVWSNERPSRTFNVGFYAGVLAAKLGLVNPEDFEKDESSAVFAKQIQEELDKNPINKQEGKKDV